MKNKNKNKFFLLLATGIVGAAFVTLSNVVFPESLSGDKLMAAFYSVALVLFAVRDCSRRPRSLHLKNAPLLRPALPIKIDARKSLDLSSHRSACIENSAA